MEVHLSVCLDSLQQSWQQGSARHLELKSLRVGNVHSGHLLDLLPHLQADIVPGAKREGESLGEASLGHGLPQLVGQLVHWQLLSHSQGLWDGFGDIVVAMGDCHILIDITRMEYVLSRRRNGHLNIVP